MISHKRAMLASCFCRAGLARLTERLARRPMLVVLVYHRIGDPNQDRFYAPLISATPEDFRTQLRIISRAYEPIDLHKLLASIDASGRLSLSRPSVLVTFDDGYRDNLTIAAPIAREFDIRPALFVTTGFLDGNSIPWWDVAAGVVNETARVALELEIPERATVRVDPSDRSGAIAAVIARFIRAGWSATEAELAHLAERADVDLAAIRAAARALFLSRDEVCGLRDAGWSIGAHTHTHRRLAALGEAEQMRELIAPKADLERILGASIRAVAYPFGSPDAFDEHTTRLAQTAGYEAGFALRPAVVRPGPIDCFAIPRFMVGPTDTASMVRARLALARVWRSPLL